MEWQEKIAELQGWNAAPKAQCWPWRTTLRVSRSEEENYVKGLALGLTGKSLGVFLSACCNVVLDVDVYEDGTCRIIGFNDTGV